MSSFERKFSKYAIPNLSLILIICYAIGYLISMVDRTGAIRSFISLDPYAIIHGQVWRLITWVLIPPSSFSIWVLIMLFFYYSIGKSLESVWGDYLYNVYIFSGLFFTVLGAFAIMIYLMLFPNNAVAALGLDEVMRQVGAFCFSTYYVNMSIFLAFAATFPDSSVLLMFFIPIKMKWLGIVYAIMLIYEMIIGTGYERVAIFASLLNFVIFYLTTQKRMRKTPIDRLRRARRAAQYQQQIRPDYSNIPKHKCAICGQTEHDNSELQFRFCSKCNGNYEYCSEHLFTHTHVQ